MIGVVPGRRWRLGGNIVLAACTAGAVLAASAAGFGALPPLGPVLVPGHGAWASAAGARLPAPQTLTLPGLVGKAAVSFDANGVATIAAAHLDDAVLALGYLHASFRLAQMDLERRQAEGRLAELTGPAGLPSDRFELRLGLLRTARREWAGMPKDSVAARALVAYSRGVNDYLSAARASGQWPALFSLANVYPRDWTPVDSLAVQGDLTQELDYTTTPLDYALLERSLGARRTLAWFPVLPVSRQSPYDLGPYRALGIAPIDATMAAAGGGPAVARALPGGTRPSPRPRTGPVPSAAVARAAAAMLAATDALPAGQVHGYPDSNAWAADGPRVLGGMSMLAGDPHLPQTLPSAWFAVAMAAPGYDVTGVSVPGLPGVLLGHNERIAWSLTDTQNQSTLFYVEKTSRSRPGQYLWQGRWRRMRAVRYAIPVRGQPARRITVEETVHGPVMTTAGQTVSVDWMGNVPSPDVAALFAIGAAGDYAQFKAALAEWRAPTQNFVYADDRGNIGAISAGYYPVVRHGSPWQPLPGTGADDVAGVIPYLAVPQSYDPAGHVVATANQRPVTGSYPYYIGTTADDFDPGYRAGREYRFLSGRHGMSASSFAALQADLTDQIAAEIVPRVTAALRRARLTPVQREAAAVLRNWNREMTPGSAGAAIWWTFWCGYLTATFAPWWRALRVPVRLDRAGLAIGPSQSSLVQVLEHWTLRDPANPAFTPPGGPARTATSVIRTAFGAAVRRLRARLGGSPRTWAWGRLHRTRFRSLTGVSALGYGPVASGGDPWTVAAAYGMPVSSDGPSWRMIVRWPGGSARPAAGAGARGKAAPGGANGGGGPGAGGAVAEGIFPGGQSEDPASPWYRNLISRWRSGRYLALPRAGAAASGPVRWVLRP